MLVKDVRAVDAFLGFFLYTISNTVIMMELTQHNTLHKYCKRNIFAAKYLVVSAVSPIFADEESLHTHCLTMYSLNVVRTDVLLHS